MIWAGECGDEELEPDGEREGLVGVRPAERDELLGPRAPGDHVPVRDGPHRHVGDERLAVTRGNRDRERVRARQRRTTGGRRQSPGRGGGQRPRRGRRLRGGAPSSRGRLSGSSARQPRASRHRPPRRARRRRSPRASGSRAPRCRPSGRRRHRSSRFSGRAWRSKPCSASHGIREKPCPSLPRCSASAKWS